jgi:orotidine-5'-phosphate decarboxylase
MDSPRQRLIVALDVSSAAAAMKIVAAISPSNVMYKVGLQLYSAVGPSVVRDLVGAGHGVFLDLKFHDIPNTVAGASKEAAKLGAKMITLHASGGGEMLRAGAEAAHAANPDCKVLAVTVLTSLDETGLSQVGVRGAVQDQVLRLAALAVASGCDGIVASVREAAMLRQEFGVRIIIVTPGIRPAGGDPADQARVATPADAIQAGADHIVVGRPITAAENPGQAVRAILGEIA